MYAKMQMASSTHAVETAEFIFMSSFWIFAEVASTERSLLRSLVQSEDSVYHFIGVSSFSKLWLFLRKVGGG